MTKTKMRKSISSVVAVVCLLLICAVLSSCSSVIKLKFKHGRLISNEHEYVFTPLAYKPVAYHTEEEYAICDHPIFGKTSYFKVAGTDGEWIYCETDDTLYHLSTVAVPTLAEMKCETAVVSTTGNRQIALGTIDDKDVVSRLTSAIISKVDTAVNPLVPPKESYHVSFCSEAYPFLVYSVYYYEYENGARLICDTDSGLLFEAGDEIHDLIEGAFDKTPESDSEKTDEK